MRRYTMWNGRGAIFRFAPEGNRHIMDSRASSRE